VLDFESLLTSEQKPEIEEGDDTVNLYHLHAVLIHRGNINFGHYYAYIKPFMNDQWFIFNDACVSEVTKTEAFSCGIGGYENQFLYYRGSNV
jgi:ubiquitin C-terminal hydrolase